MAMIGKTPVRIVFVRDTRSHSYNRVSRGNVVAMAKDTKGNVLAQGEGTTKLKASRSLISVRSAQPQPAA